MKFTNFFWDFDGMIADSYGCITLSMQNALQEFGVFVPFDELYRECKVSLYTAYQNHAKALGLEYSDLLKQYRLHEHALSHDHIHLYQGMKELLFMLYEQGAQHYLYTHRGESVFPLLEKFGIYELFEDFVTSDKGFPNKPAPDALLYLMEKHQLDKNTCLMLGDRKIDVLSGNNAGMAGLLFDPEECYTDFSTELSVRSVWDLRELLCPKRAFQPFRDRLEKQIADITTRYASAGYFPSAVVRVFDSCQTLSTFSIGDVGQDSLFDVSSLTHLATSTMVLRSIRQGKFALDSLLTDLLEEISQDAYLETRLKGITVAQLLTHHSTLLGWYPCYMHHKEDFFTMFKHALQSSKPVNKVQYSDLNYMLLGKVLEKVEGKPLETLLQEHLVTPLGLGSMLYHPTETWRVVPSGYGNPQEAKMCQEKGFMYNHFRPIDKAIVGGVYDGNAHHYFGGVAGHAGIFATPFAFEKLCQFYMKHHRGIFADAGKEQVPGKGFAWQISPLFPHGCGHTGFTGTCVYYSQTYDIGVVAFTNSRYFQKKKAVATDDFRRALHEGVLAIVQGSL